ncbi:MAG: pcrB family protein [Bacillales bacterium]|jgi:putative glycerol-1-phosphate prenyltransferase|nr:pcrB family protein [Bacillales bacterium]
MFKSWRHVFKLDPNKSISDRDLEHICKSGTDAIIIGGSDGVTVENVKHLLSRVKVYNLPVALEVSNTDIAVSGFDLYMIPTVLNSNKTEWILGNHIEAIKKYGYLLEFINYTVEGYVVINKNSKVAQLTDAKCDITEEDIVAYAQVCEKILKLPIMYIEYSGTFGDFNLIREAASRLNNTHLFYGGGISNGEQALEMSKYANTVVVGNIIYEDIKLALETVEYVK